jgi:hypothetical protein
MGFGMLELFVILFLLGTILCIVALIDILRSEFTGNNKLVWLLVVIFFPLIGSILYFVLGPKQKVS